jgi:hypothetical protein
LGFELTAGFAEEKGAGIPSHTTNRLFGDLFDDLQDLSGLLCVLMFIFV